MKHSLTHTHTQNSPHTKLLGGAWKMLVPLRLSGWAQVAPTLACKERVTNQLGSHWSWQSQRKLSLWMRLKVAQKDQDKSPIAFWEGEVCVHKPQKNSQSFELLHFTEGIRLDRANSIVSQVPVGTLLTVTVQYRSTSQSHLHSHKKGDTDDTWLDVLHCNFWRNSHKTTMIV